MRKVYLEYEEFGLMMNELVDKIKKSKLKFDGVYGVPRGGLSLALHLSHNLKIPILLYPTKDSLVTDDIADTGKTLKSHKNKKIACLYSTKWTETKPDFFVRYKESKDDWVVYPWEER